MPRLTDPPSMITERVSWDLTEADEPETRPEKSGTPIIDRSGLPDGLGSSRRMPTSIESFFLHLQPHARTSPNLVPYPSPI
jgi:hypothetical protein